MRIESDGEWLVIVISYRTFNENLAKSINSVAERPTTRKEKLNKSLKSVI